MGTRGRDVMYNTLLGYLCHRFESRHQHTNQEYSLREFSGGYIYKKFFKILFHKKMADPNSTVQMKSRTVGVVLLRKLFGDQSTDILFNKVLQSININPLSADEATQGNITTEKFNAMKDELKRRNIKADSLLAQVIQPAIQTLYPPQYIENIYAISFIIDDYIQEPQERM
jgi:hypothetical protein